MDISKLEREAEEGSLPAQAVLGLCYLHGYEVKADHQRAFRLLSAAAAKGAPRAVLNLARMYAAGLGTPPDVSRAIQLYESVKRSPVDEFDACIELGRLYARGDGVGVDEAKASEWYTFAVRIGETLGESDELTEARSFIAGTS